MASSAMLRKKIRELEERAESDPDGRLSRANEVTLKMTRIELGCEGRDQILVVMPAGVMDPGRLAKPRIVEATASRAAEMLANLNGAGERARLATEDEKKAFRDYNATLTARAKQKISDDKMAAAQAALHSALGIVGTNAGAQASTAATDVTQPVVEPIPSADGSIPAATPDGEPATADGSDIPPVTMTPLSDQVTELLKGDTETALRGAGYDTMEKLAEADVKALASDVSGVGKATAAKLITAAAEGLADAE